MEVKEVMIYTRQENRSRNRLEEGVSKSEREKIMNIGKGVNKYKISDNFVGKCHYETPNLTKNE